MRIWKKDIGWVKFENADNSHVPPLKQDLSNDLKQNLDTITKALGDAQDLTIRKFTMASDDKVKAAVVALEGMTEHNLINEQVLKNLMLDVRFEDPTGNQALFQRIKTNGISSLAIKEVKTIDEAVKGIIAGDTVFLLDGVNQALVIGSRGFKQRAVSDPLTEGVVRGPRDGFTETLSNNIALIRRRIKSPDLRLFGLKVGERTQTDVSIVYLEGVAKPELVDEVKKRIEKIKIDGVLESGYLEEFIEDSPFSPFPQIEHTERPDKVSAAILEGRVAIMVDTTPFVLIVPTIFLQFIQAVEDYYERFYFGSFIRGIRFLALFLSIAMPALYIAVTSFHQEMIPTPLALSIAASREGIPFPTVGEALIMEATFEILREAGIRLPRPTGQAVSIVGALVIGQAAVQAGIVSQAMVIIVALTGICSFAVPAFNIGVAGRLLKFPLMLAAAFLGLPGIMAGLSIILIHLAGLRSFGVNYLDPVTSPNLNEFKDFTVRAP